MIGVERDDGAYIDIAISMASRHAATSDCAMRPPLSTMIFNATPPQSATRHDDHFGRRGDGAAMMYFAVDKGFIRLCYYCALARDERAVELRFDDGADWANCRASIAGGCAIIADIYVISDWH